MGRLGNIGAVQTEAGPETLLSIQRLDDRVRSIELFAPRLIQNNVITLLNPTLINTTIIGDLALLDDEYLYWRKTPTTPVTSRSAGIRWHSGGISPDRFEFDPGLTTAMVLDTTGRVGIGLTVPLASLHIVGDASSGPLQIQNRALAGVPTRNFIRTISGEPHRSSSLLVFEQVNTGSTGDTSFCLSATMAEYGNGIEVVPSTTDPVGTWGFSIRNPDDATGSRILFNAAPTGNTSITPNWRDPGTTFRALDVNPLDTNSAAGSFLLSLRKASTARLVTLKTGATTISPENDITPLTLTGGSITAAASTPFLSITGTWANASATPNAILLNVTNSSSAATANLMNLQVGAVKQFGVSKAGTAYMLGFQLPTGAGAGKVLISDGSGVGTWQTVGASGALTGTGTTDSIPKWTSATVLGDSAISDDGSQINMAAGGTRGVFINGPGDSEAIEIDAGAFTAFVAPAFNLYASSVSGTYGGDLFALDAVADTASTDWNIMALYNTGLPILQVGNHGTIRVTNASVTGSGADGFWDFQGTWNTSGNPTAISLNLTNTASGAGSGLLDLAVNSVSALFVGKGGDTAIASGNNLKTLNLTGGQTTGSGTTGHFSGTGIWNTSGAPTAFKWNQTNTASGAGAQLFDWQLGGASLLKLSKNGQLQLTTNATAGSTFRSLHNVSTTGQSEGFSWEPAGTLTGGTSITKGMIFEMSNLGGSAGTLIGCEVALQNDFAPSTLILSGVRVGLVMGNSTHDQLSAVEIFYGDDAGGSGGGSTFNNFYGINMYEYSNAGSTFTNWTGIIVGAPSATVTNTANALRLDGHAELTRGVSLWWGVSTATNYASRDAFVRYDATSDRIVLGIDTGDTAAFGANGGISMGYGGRLFFGANPTSTFASRTSAIQGNNSNLKFEIGTTFLAQLDASDWTLTGIPIKFVSMNATSPAIGELFYDNLQLTMRAGENIGTVGLVGRIYSNTADSTELNGLTTGDQDFSTSYSIPAGSLAIGKVLRVTAYGKYSSDAVTPGNLTLLVKAGSVTLTSTGAVPLIAAASARGWSVNALVSVRGTGAGGTVTSTSCSTIDNGLISGVITDPSNGTQAWDTTTAQTLKLSANFSVADADNKATLENIVIEALN